MKVITEDVRRTEHPLSYGENVEIVGTIRSGVRIHAAGDLGVYGNVEDAEIEAGGNVVIGGGFLGSGAGTITCGGNLQARFVQSQRIEAGGDVWIEKTVLSSTVFSSGDVLVGDGEGNIVGGEIHAYGKVEAAILGSPRPVTTRIEVGLDPVIALRTEKLEHRAIQLAKRRMDCIKNLTFMSKAVDQCQESDALVDIKAVVDGIQRDLIAVGEEIYELRKNARLNRNSRVIVRKASYPPLEISICFSRIINETTTGMVVFKLAEGRIILDTQSPD